LKDTPFNAGRNHKAPLLKTLGLVEPYLLEKSPPTSLFSFQNGAWTDARAKKQNLSKVSKQNTKKAFFNNPNATTEFPCTSEKNENTQAPMRA
jgi:hypothetical protein